MRTDNLLLTVARNWYGYPLSANRIRKMDRVWNGYIKAVRMRTISDFTKAWQARIEQNRKEETLVRPPQSMTRAEVMVELQSFKQPKAAEIAIKDSPEFRERRAALWRRLDQLSGR